jgi:Protein of unknown function (DUF3768)
MEMKPELQFVQSMAEKIAILNDKLRTQGEGGEVVVTSALVLKGPIFVLQAQQLVREYQNFSRDNNPFGERDFGSFELLGEVVMWQVAYFTKDFVMGSPDPSDTDVTARVLTIMLAADY